MRDNLSYIKAIELLHECSSAEGFLASKENTSNYKRVWARDGVICGLAALASGNTYLIKTSLLSQTWICYPQSTIF